MIGVGPEGRYHIVDAASADAEAAPGRSKLPRMRSRKGGRSVVKGRMESMNDWIEFP